MTFDVAQLQGRASELKTACIETSKRLAASNPAGMAPPGSDQLIESTFADTDTIYDNWLDIPSPDDFVWMVTDMDTALQNLATHDYDHNLVTKQTTPIEVHAPVVGIDTTNVDLHDWTGAAAAAYERGFAKYWEPCVQDQFLMTSIIQQGINAEAGIWQDTREQLDKLSQDAIDRVNKCGHKGGGDGWKVLLTLAAGVVTISGAALGTALSGGSAAPLAFTAVATAINVTGSALGAKGAPDHDSLNLSTGRPDAIVASLQTALDRLSSEIAAGEQKIASAMKGVTTASQQNKHTLVIPRPALADPGGHRVGDPAILGTDA